MRWHSYLATRHWNPCSQLHLVWKGFHQSKTSNYPFYLWIAIGIQQTQCAHKSPKRQCPLVSIPHYLRILWKKFGAHYFQRGRKQWEQRIGVCLGAFTFSIFGSDFCKIFFLLEIIDVHSVGIPPFSIKFCFLLKNHFLYRGILC